jgi:NAD(P)-dependent dehydrogenase (short-subunit alcohol dehydrogenase family)
LPRWAVTGINSEIIKALEDRRSGEPFERIEYRDYLVQTRQSGATPPRADRYVLAHGYLANALARYQSLDEILSHWDGNAISTIRLGEAILDLYPAARICVLGSMSGIAGSANVHYGAAKAAVHQWVTTRAVGPRQQLVAVAPGIVAQTGMTRRRPDQDRVDDRARQEAKGLPLPQDVAQAIEGLLAGPIWVNNVVVPIDGGRS